MSSKFYFSIDHVNSFLEAARDVQSQYDRLQGYDEKVQTEAEAAAHELGRCVWLECSHPEEVQPIADSLKGMLKIEFILGLKKTLDLPSSQANNIADNLRPFVYQALTHHQR